MPKTKWGSVIFTAYKFFDSKELLFFAVLEDIHTEGFAVRHWQNDIYDLTTWAE